MKRPSLAGFLISEQWTIRALDQWDTAVYCANALLGAFFRPGGQCTEYHRQDFQLGLQSARLPFRCPDEACPCPLSMLAAGHLPLGGPASVSLRTLFDWLVWKERQNQGLALLQIGSYLIRIRASSRKGIAFEYIVPRDTRAEGAKPGHAGTILQGIIQ